MSKYDAVYFVGDNQAINRLRVDSSKTRNRGAFSDSLAPLIISITNILHMLTSFTDYFALFHQGRFVFVSKNLFLVLVALVLIFIAVHLHCHIENLSLDSCQCPL